LDEEGVEAVRAVVQRVSSASVTVDGQCLGGFGRGLVVLVAVAEGDTEDDAAYLAEKIAYLRVFEDEDGKMNRSLLETGGAVLAISQFTLMGDCRKGRRPSFIDAARPEEGKRLYEVFCAAVRSSGVSIETGRFQAMMQVALVNDGPVTILLDSRKTF
jgi:D-tyrosyl-tRNA(Tyr) deacylase